MVVARVRRIADASCRGKICNPVIFTRDDGCRRQTYGIPASNYAGAAVVRVEHYTGVQGVIRVQGHFDAACVGAFNPDLGDVARV